MLIHEVQLTTPEAYEATAAVHNALWDELPTTGDLLRQEDDNSRKMGLVRRRYAAQQDGQIIAVGSFFHSAIYWFHRPGRFGINMGVLPTFRRQGIGGSLYERMMADLSAYHPVELFNGTSESQTEGVRFLIQRGFAEVMRNHESVLYIADFDDRRFAGNQERVRADGIEIKTFDELESDPERDEKLYRLDTKLSQDVPMPGRPSDFSLEDWKTKHSAQDPDFLPSGMMIAVHDGQYVGVSELYQRGETDLLQNGLTGVLPEYRRRGIAMALKLRAIEASKQLGKRRIITWNDQHNHMFDLNVKLGFVAQPDVILFLKQL